MTPFIALQPTTLADAVRHLAEHGPQTKVMSGGQSLLLALKERIVRPAYVLSLANLPGLNGLKLAPDGRLEVGTACTYARLAKAGLLGWHAEIGHVCGNLADRSTRNMGTIGGGACEANARYDVPTLLVATDAILSLASATATRRLAAADFFNLAGGTHLGYDEILTGISFPPAQAFGFVGFDKFRTRVFDAALVNVCCSLAQAADGTVTAVRIAVGGVALAPLLATAAASRLIGAGPHGWDCAAVAAAVSEEVLPIAQATTRRRQFQSELIKSLMLALLQRAATAREGV